MSNAEQNGRQTLALTPEDSWRVRRELFGLNATLRVDEAAQAVLQTERALVLAEVYGSIDE